MAGTPHGPLDAEARMADFTDLVATVIANAETRVQFDSLGGSFVTAETGKMYGYLVSAGWSPD
jgi:hypothetical protein